MSGRQEATPTTPSSATTAAVADDGHDAADTSSSSGGAAVAAAAAAPTPVPVSFQQRFGSNRRPGSWIAAASTIAPVSFQQQQHQQFSSNCSATSVAVPVLFQQQHQQQQQQQFSFTRSATSTAVPMSIQQQQQPFASYVSAGSWAADQPIRRAKSTVFGLDETFELQPASLQVPQHVWEHHGGQFSLPHHHSDLPAGGGVEGARRFGRRLRRLVHVPGLPVWRNWPFMRQHWLADLCAGLTCAVMLVPQGLAYMMMASLPPIMGMHTASIAPFFFAVLGTTRNVLSVGACPY